ncbi:hypothetical protein [Streptomyces violaceusniger]|uniref:hypothetical protein n=1 Tax=Streptomyces violaceusniger TaxID=68280 RepID=UPI0031D40363
MMLNKWGTSASASAAVLFAALLTAPSAHASDDDRARRRDAGQHCVMNVADGSVACYNSFRDAIRAATDGRVADAPEDAHLAATEEYGILADPILSVSYQHPNYNRDRDGATMTLRGAGGCDSDDGVEHALYDIDDIDTKWDDTVSSFISSSNCQAEYYEHPGYGGSRTGWRNSMADMGAMEDEASSIRWR